MDGKMQSDDAQKDPQVVQQPAQPVQLATDPVPGASSLPPTVPEVKKYSHRLTIVLLVVVAGLAVAGAFVSLYGVKDYQQTDSQAYITPSPAPTTDPTSDAGLAEASEALDENIDAVDTGNTVVDEGLQDQPGDLSE